MLGYPTEKWKNYHKKVHVLKIKAISQFRFCCDEFTSSTSICGYKGRPSKQWNQEF